MILHARYMNECANREKLKNPSLGREGIEIFLSSESETITKTILLYQEDSGKYFILDFV